MSPLFAALFYLLAPAYLAGSALLFWAGKSHAAGLAKVLRNSVWVILPLLTATFLLMVIGAGTCQGDVLYGYNNCTVFPPQLAAFWVLLFLGLLISTAIYVLTLAIIGGIIEFRTRR